MVILKIYQKKLAFNTNYIGNWTSYSPADISSTVLITKYSVTYNEFSVENITYDDSNDRYTCSYTNESGETKVASFRVDAQGYLEFTIDETSVFYQKAE